MVESSFNSRIAKNSEESLILTTALYVNSYPLNIQTMNITTESVALSYRWVPPTGLSTLSLRVSTSDISIEIGSMVYAARTNVYVNNLTILDNITEGHLTKISVDVHNRGGITLNLSVQFYVNEKVYSSTNILIDPNSTRSIEFSYIPKKNDYLISVYLSDVVDDLYYHDNNISYAISVTPKEGENLTIKALQIIFILASSAVCIFAALIGLLNYKKDQTRIFGNE